MCSSHFFYKKKIIQFCMIITQNVFINTNVFIRTHTYSCVHVVRLFLCIYMSVCDYICLYGEKNVFMYWHINVSMVWTHSCWWTQMCPWCVPARARAHTHKHTHTHTRSHTNTYTRRDCARRTRSRRTCSLHRALGHASSAQGGRQPV
jgi:hypothetical protein